MKYFSMPSDPVIKTIIYTVMQKYPECKVFYKPDEEDTPFIEIRFFEKDRQKNHLYTAQRKYRIINGHIFIGNGFVNPFEYDELARLIEQTELDMAVKDKRRIYVNTRAAINKAVDFFNNTKVIIGNATGSACDIELMHNDVMRYYKYVDNDDSHLEKYPSEITFGPDAKGYSMGTLDSKISYKIIRTVFPGLKVEAAEYICGIRDGKEDWKSPEDAYFFDSMNMVYATFQLRPLDIVYDEFDCIAIDEYADEPMRHMILTDGREFAYRIDKIKEPVLEDWDKYFKKRSDLISDYMIRAVKVCKEAGISLNLAIEMLNESDSKTKLVFKKYEDVVQDVIKKMFDDPFYGLNEKVIRSVARTYPNVEFHTVIRTAKNDPFTRYVAINWGGKNYRLSILFHDQNFVVLWDPHLKLNYIPAEVEEYQKALQTECNAIRDSVYGVTFVVKKNMTDKGWTQDGQMVEKKQCAVIMEKSETGIAILPLDKRVVLQNKTQDDMDENLKNDILSSLDSKTGWQIAEKQ